MSFQNLSGMMFDVETLGRRAGCVILSIGAVRFDIDSKTISDEFYVTIDAADSKAHGLHTDPETLEWWKGQRPEALKEAIRNALPAKEAYNKFYEYAQRFKGQKVWAWGPQFDVVNVEAAMLQVNGQSAPWKYWDVMDGRTLQHLLNIQIKRDENKHHNALEDAREQAQYVIECLNP